jgi:hypothetical protein
VCAKGERERNQKQQRPAKGDFAEVVMPDVGEKQGPQRDGKQDKGEGDAPCEAKLGGVKFGGLGEGGRNQRQQGRNNLNGFHGFPVWLCCDTHGLFAREAGRGWIFV